MNTTATVGLSSCRMMSLAPGEYPPQTMLHLADHGPEDQPFALREFRASTTAVVPPSREEHPLSFVAAVHRRDQARRRPHCRAA